MKALLLWGSGGHGREVLEMVRDLNALRPAWDVRGWLDDDAQRHGAAVAGLPVLGSEEIVLTLPDASVVIAVGDAAARAGLVARLQSRQLDYATVVHPSARLGCGVEIGAGSMVFPGVTTTIDARLGMHVIVNLGASISHDCEVDDFATLGPGVRLAGNVRVGRGCTLGMQTAVLPGCRIGDGTVVGAGATVIRSLPAGVLAVGTPARVVRDIG